MFEQLAARLRLRYGGHAAGSTRGARRTLGQEAAPRAPCGFAPVARAWPPPRREAGLGRPRRVQCDQGRHSRVFVAAQPPAPAHAGPRETSKDYAQRVDDAS